MGAVQNRKPCFIVACGFTLVEICIVMIILGLILTAFLPFYKNYIAQYQIKKMEKNVSTVRAALGDFIIDDQMDPDDPSEVRFPRPASLSARIGSAGFGSEVPDMTYIATGTCMYDVCVIANERGERVLIGAVPVRALEIGGEYMMDPYKDRFTYAVTESLTKPQSMRNMSSEGALRIIDETGVVTDSAQFVLISHGRDGKGSYTVEGAKKSRPCKLNSHGDAENCDNDATFRYALGENNSNTDNYYDDNTTFTLAVDSNQWWEQTNSSGNNIVNRNVQNVGIGFTTGDPEHKLDVNGTIQSRKDVLALDDIRAGSNITAKGEIKAGGNIESGRTMTANNVVAKGNVVGNGVAAEKNIVAGESIQAGKDIIATEDVLSGKDVSAQNVLVGQNIEARGDIVGRAFYYNGGVAVSGGSDQTPPFASLTILCPNGYYLQGIKKNNAVCVALPKAKAQSSARPSIR